MTDSSSPLIILKPVVQMVFPVRATAITQHILFDDIVMIGFEDGSVRVVELNDSSWDVLNVLKSVCGWYESSPIRSIICSSYKEEEVMVMNEVDGMEVSNE